ncbi:MAG: hypothetical protein R2864_09685 [Syntrophotaleaceae bacterium]
MSCQTVPAEDAIRRDPAAYADNRYDLIIVGGGIYGVTLALESVAAWVTVSGA